jgi:chaperonin GroES
MATTTSTKIRPLGDRLVVRPLEETEQMRGGLYIPDTAKEKPQQGEVLAVGPGRRNDEGKRVEMDVKEGDIVLFSKYGGQEFDMGGEKVLVIKESELYGVMEK